MARIRTIKPEFFCHEQLAELSPIHRLLFIGLWTQADREGRLEDRPKRLKAVLFPYDDCDVEQLLTELAGPGFILRYDIDGKHFIQILGFLKHQRPHPKEPASEIPAPLCREKKRRAVKKNGQTMSDPSLREGKGKEEDMGENLRPQANGDGSHEVKTAASSRGPDQYAVEFEQVKMIYPRRDGDQRWKATLGHYRAARKGGESMEVIMDGVHRYRAWCERKGLINTDKVKQAATFMGPEKCWREPWEVPKVAAGGFVG